MLATRLRLIACRLPMSATTFNTRVLPCPLTGVRFPAPESPDAQQPQFPSTSDGEQALASLRQAAEEVRRGGLVAFPTETVYGLGADACNPAAVRGIYAAKGRPSDNPLIVHIAHTAMLASLCEMDDMPPAYNVLMSRFWPGSLTLLFPVKEGKLPPVVTAQLATVGIRMPSHPLARALIALSDCPLAAPSSNASGRPSPTCAEHVFYDLGGPLDKALGKEQRGRVRYILDGGASGVGLESTVVDGLTSRNEVRILRPGGVSVEAIESALAEAHLLGSGPGMVTVQVYGRDMRDAQQELTPTTPGMKYRHYSPNAPVVALDVDNEGIPLVDLLQREADAYTSTRSTPFSAGLMVARGSSLLKRIEALAPGENVQEGVRWFSVPLAVGKAQVYVYDMGAHASDEAARRLFSGLRYLDEQVPGGCAVILVETVPREHIGLAVMNRLDKAASERIRVQA